ncbi:hypothetical protein BC826DRAFT_1002453 [Russula brevipes]|nr:hypothetical protein BC826DRAFT_1002453 [Russula brevipes]
MMGWGLVSSLRVKGGAAVVVVVACRVGKGSGTVLASGGCLSQDSTSASGRGEGRCTVIVTASLFWFTTTLQVVVTVVPVSLKHARARG